MSSTTKQLRGFYDRKGVKWNLPTEAGTEVPSVEIAEIEQSLVGKVDVIEDPALAAGNFASINSKGGIANSGKKASDFLPATPIDTTPTANSDNLVTSGGVKDALNGKAAVIHTHTISQITGLEAALSERALQPSDNYLVICKKYVEDASVPAYPVSETYSQTIDYLNEFVEAHASEISGTINKYIPCIVELKTASAASGNKVFAIVRLYNINSSDDLRIEVYVGSSIFSIYGEAGAQGYTWTAGGAAGWAKTDYSTF